MCIHTDPFTCTQNTQHSVSITISASSPQLSLWKDYMQVNKIHVQYYTKNMNGHVQLYATCTGTVKIVTNKLNPIHIRDPIITYLPHWQALKYLNYYSMTMLSCQVKWCMTHLCRH